MSDMTVNGQDVRIETDSLGEVAVPAHVHWGAQTQRSIVNFPIGGEKMRRRWCGRWESRSLLRPRRT